MPSETILVVEDEPFVARLVADCLAPLAVEVLLAANGVEALELAWEKVPALILLDVMLPKLDGFEVARLLQQHPRTAGIPIIFLTARDVVRDRVRGLELGAWDYLVKPFQPEELLARVRGVLQRARAGRAPLSGSLDAMSLPTLLQLLEAERRSGVLTLT